MHEQSSKSSQSNLEVAVVDPEIIQIIFNLLKLKWGSKRIASELEISRNTVRRYVKLGREGLAGPIARKPPEGQAALSMAAQEFFLQQAQGNAVVVQRLLAAEGAPRHLRTVQRMVAPARKAKKHAESATVRFESRPGAQMQIDFGQKWVMLGAHRVRVYLFVAVLGYSRRIFVTAGLSERQEDWQEGILAAFTHFGGCTEHILIDNPKAMVLSHTQGGTPCLHPAFAQFSKDLGVAVRTCRPYRARTKGKVESGVKYVKRNALAGLPFMSMAALQSCLTAWMRAVDQRVHGTTRQTPMARFVETEQAALRPLAQRPVVARTRSVSRKVSADALVNVDTVRYSVPVAFVGEQVSVGVGDTVVSICAGGTCIAEHPRCLEPHRRITRPEHYADLRSKSEIVPAPAVKAEDGPGRSDDSLTGMGRSLEDYAKVLDGAS